MEELKEKALHPPKTASTVVLAPKTQFDELDPEVQLAIRCAADKKATELVALDLRQIASFAEFFVIASGSNQRQVQAIADEINEQLKKQLDTRPIRVEGYNSAEWVLLDYGDFIVHVFNNESREFYDLERLWRDARKVQLPQDI